MAKPYIHAQLDVRRWGGKPEDTVAIHDLFDSSKAVFADNRHRALTHHAWFIFVAERIFGHNITNSAGRVISVRDLGEQNHVQADFGNKFIPTAEDYLAFIDQQDWMKIDGVDSAVAHAEASAEQFGGLASDYLAIHEVINSSQQVMGDERHAALTHHSFFIALLDRMFGHTIVNTDGTPVAVRAIADKHVRDDFGFIPSPQDWLQHLEFQPWFNNGVRGVPNSYRKIHEMKSGARVTRRQIFSFTEEPAAEPQTSQDAERDAELAYRLD